MLFVQALDLAVEATKAAQFKDWWWKVQLAKCYFLLGLMRDAEQQLRSSLKQQATIEGCVGSHKKHTCHTTKWQNI